MRACSEVYHRSLLDTAVRARCNGSVLHSPRESSTTDGRWLNNSIFSKFIILLDDTILFVR